MLTGKHDGLRQGISSPPLERNTPSLFKPRTPDPLGLAPESRISTEESQEKSMPWKKEFNMELEKPARRI